MALGFQDNPGNILGTNTANNLYSSDLVAANADGSMIERLEHLKDSVAAISGNLPGNWAWGVAPAGTNSTTAVVIAGLAGFGDDFFNDEYYMQILKNADSAGNAPEKQVRKITDYASATGTFTCDAFGAAIGASDICLILHESIIAIGRDDNNNIFASTNVAANADGSLLERLEFVQATLGAAVGASLSADIAAVKAAVDTVDDFVDTEVAAIKTETDKIAGGIALGGLGGGVVRKTVTFANTGEDVALFTVTGDVIVRMVGVCSTNIESAAGCNISVVANAVPLIAVTDCTLLEAGEIWHDATPDAEVEAASVLREFIIADGNDISIDVETAKQVDSGVMQFYCFYTALSANGAVVAA